MTRIILARDLDLANIPGAIVRSAKPEKERKAIPRKSLKEKRPKPRAPRGTVTIRKLDDTFSRIIRDRDCPQGIGKCCTCGKFITPGSSDCGHYLGRQHFATRWDPMNCAAQCRHCNRFEEGKKSEFRVHLVKLHGEEAITRMEALHKTGRKPSPTEAAAIMERIKA